MFQGAEIVRMAKEMAQHASLRQAEIARNVANADTPGYRAKDVLPFEEVYTAAPVQQPRITRAGHMSGLDPVSMTASYVDARSEPSPNGNSVSLETEMLKAAEVRQSHGLALAVYQTSLDLMRTALGRGR